MNRPPTEAPSLSEELAAARHALVEAGLRPEDAALDVDVLARYVLGWDLARLLAHNREPATASFVERFRPLVARRARREPIAYIVGHREFWGLEFEVTPDTLIPRPETELIVEEALREMPADARWLVLDVGTGSGCLAVAIAKERPLARVIATDISHPALIVARRNATTHGVSERIAFVASDLASGLRVRADLIVSNPPYVPAASAPSLPLDVAQYEPAQAVFGGDDGLSVIRRLLAELGDCLVPGGRFIVEFGFGQEDDVVKAARERGWHVADVLQDLQGIARTAVLRR